MFNAAGPGDRDRQVGVLDRPVCAAARGRQHARDTAVRRCRHDTRRRRVVQRQRDASL